MPGWDEKPNQFRYRIKEPDLFIQTSFRTITLTTGVTKVIGKLKSDPQGSTKGQSLRFDKKIFTTLDQAKKWLNDHPNAKKDATNNANIKFITLNTVINV